MLSNKSNFLHFLLKGQTTLFWIRMDREGYSDARADREEEGASSVPLRVLGLEDKSSQRLQEQKREL